MGEVGVGEGGGECWGENGDNCNGTTIKKVKNKEKKEKSNKHTEKGAVSPRPRQHLPLSVSLATAAPRGGGHLAAVLTCVSLVTDDGEHPLEYSLAQTSRS